MRPSTLIVLLGAAVRMGPRGCAGTPKAPPPDSQAVFRSFDLNRDGKNQPQ